jgi:hypothetical protein
MYVPLVTKLKGVRVTRLSGRIYSNPSFLFLSRSYLCNFRVYFQEYVVLIG